MEPRYLLGHECLYLHPAKEAEEARRMGLIADAATGAESSCNYDHGIMTMIMELSNEENGCRFF
jgi:hypothetical protein